MKLDLQRGFVPNAVKRFLNITRRANDMSRFLNQLEMKTLRGVSLIDKPFEVTEDLLYMTDELACSDSILVKAPFRTDLASIPRFLWWIVGPPSGWYREACVVHDWLCPQFDEDGLRLPHICDSETAADILYEGMLDIIKHSDWKKRLKRRRVLQAKIMRWGVDKHGPQFESDSCGGGA